MNLLIDLGNSRLKWAVIKNNELMPGETFNNQTVNEDCLMSVWKAIDPPQRIGIACVASRPLLTLVQRVATILWPTAEIKHAKSEAQGFGVTNAYEYPEKLGVDRWLALIATRHYYSIPACIVDCGTAITVDFLDSQGKHQGGFIIPGLKLMKQALANGTNTLPFNELDYALGPANFTEAAIYSGTLSAAVGLIEYLVRNDAGNTRLILTGGDAELIAKQLNMTCVIDNHLVLRGLSRTLIDV